MKQGTCHFGVVAVACTVALGGCLPGSRSEVRGARPVAIVRAEQQSIRVLFPVVDLGLQAGLPPRDSSGFPLHLEFAVAIQGAQTVKFKISAEALADPSALERVAARGELVGCNDPEHLVVCDRRLAGTAVVEDGRLVLQVRDAAYLAQITATGADSARLWVQRYWGSPPMWQALVPLVR